MISHLSGRAEAWATAEWARKSPVCSSVNLFSETLRKVFDRTAPGREAARALVGLRQGRRRAIDYAIEFRTLAADSGWNAASLCDAFLFGLSDTLKDHLVPLELPSDLDTLISLAIKIDTRLSERERSRGPTSSHKGPSQPPGCPPWRPSPHTAPASPPPASSANSEEPMQLGRTSLSPEERQRRLREGRCIYCGQKGHFLSSCPVKDGARR